jgi:valyl-tRNA synthetase
LEDEEMSLRELAMPSMEDIEMQKSDLTLATTHYEVKPRIINLVATNPFRGLEDDNPYRHIKEFTMICNTVQQEGVLDTWFKWNLFPFSRRQSAKMVYTCVH